MRRGEALRNRLSRAEPQAARGPLWGAVALSAAGLVLSLLLVRVHAQALAGIESFCTINDVVNCDRVAVSPYSVFLGMPVALWGVFGYALAGALALVAVRGERSRSVRWAGLLFAVAAVAVAVTIVLAYISEARIGALCLLCAGSWATSIALLACAWRASRSRGVGAAVRDGLTMLRAHVGWTAAAAVAAIAIVAVAAQGYARYAERPRVRPAPSRTPGTAGTAATAAAGAPAGPPVVVEYSDYECPFCGRAHEQTRLLREKRPDVTLVRRQFPLDMACNPLVKQPVHQSACTLARAAICAQEQGQFTAMDDALFKNQHEHASVVELAKRVGLDVGRFQACITSPESAQRLQADIAAGIRDGVRATPTYIVGGVVRTGEFPWELLPPPPATAPAPRQSQ